MGRLRNTDHMSHSVFLILHLLLDKQGLIIITTLQSEIKKTNQKLLYTYHGIAFEWSNKCGKDSTCRVHCAVERNMHDPSPYTAC